MKLFLAFLFPCALFAQSPAESAAEAAKRGDLPALKLLIEKSNLSPNGQIDGAPLIFYARKSKTARTLLDLGASPTAPDGRTMLMKAAGEGNAAMFNFFLKKGGVLAVDNQKWTALHYLAGGSAKPSFAKKLLKAGADINAQDEALWTPLMLASFRAKPALVKLLIGGGAKVHLKNKGGQTALGLASPMAEWAVNKADYNKVIELLKNAGAR